MNGLLAQVLVSEIPVARLAFDFSFVVARPADEVARLLKLAGTEAVVEICRQKTVLILQSGEFRLQSMDVADDLFSCRGGKVGDGGGANKSAGGWALRGTARSRFDRLAKTTAQSPHPRNAGRW